MSINNFDVMKRMSDEDQDIRLAGLGNIISMKKVKAGTQITLGVQGDVLVTIYLPHKSRLECGAWTDNDSWRIRELRAGSSVLHWGRQ